MKTLLIHTFKITFQTVFMIVLLTNSCAQSKNETTTTSTKTDSAISKPDIDIQTAVLSGNLEAVKQHIASGSDINKKEAMSGSTPLMTAATFNKVEIAKALIDAGADLTLKNNDGSTVLHTAAFFGRIEIVQLLIDAKADKTIKNNFGATARETVMGDFNEVKPFYEMLIQQLKPMGFTLDMEALKKARPVVAMMLE
ncbi:ankyrin repeat domain-containing protein [Corallibacter sp.]|uniref:ankyrin repeat domain-containing protein n=1 Tax=Corallibacter sp. TaxID=2038084 RepID=UPI003A8D8943